jgi:hypothetical protein
VAVLGANKVYFLGLPGFNHLPLEQMVVIELAIGTVMGVDIYLLALYIKA